MIKVTRKLHFERGERGRRRITDKPAPEVEPGRIPRVSRLMALAIRFNRLIREGTVADQSELARLCHVTQPRMTQIMNLLHLAPDIQEAVLFLPRYEAGRPSLTEKQLRPIAAKTDWRRQRTMWGRLVHSATVSPASTPPSSLPAIR